MRLRLGRTLALLGLVAVSARSGIAQESSGTIAGTVVDAGGHPLSSTQVSVVGTRRGAQTDEQGRYRITGAPIGDVQVNAQRIGYAPVRRLATVTAGGTATVDFSLSPVATKLDEIVVTATGETQRQRETGNSVSTIDTAQLNPAAVTNLDQVLTARAAGVVVQTAGGTTGGGSRIRIRGSNSVSLSNDPLLIIDGVRVNNTSTSTSIGVGGQQPSRFDDIPAEEIENIEIIKGPAAAALYGTAAANGVIQITTKKGRAGKTIWNVFAEGGTLNDVNVYPKNYLEFGKRTSNGSLTLNCNIDFQSRGICTPDSLVVNDPIHETNVLQHGNRRQSGVSVAGGTDAATYFISGGLEHEQGVYSINQLQRLSLRTNVRGQLARNVDATASIGYVGSDLRLPQNDNDLLGTISGGLLGTAYDCGPKQSYPLLCGSDTTSRGYAAGQPPQAIFNINTRQQLQRLTGSLTSNWQTRSWLSFNGVLGGDIANRFDNETLQPGLVTFGSLPDGYRQANRAVISTYTANGNGTATGNITPNLRSTSSAGVQYNDELFTRTDAFGAKLLAGTGSLAGTNARFAVGEQTTENRTIGGYLREEFAFRDRVFLTGAVRSDKNSAFGQNFKLITYPSVSASWVVGEEPFFPQRLSAVSSLRLRAAYGESGQRPGLRDAITYENPVAVNVGGQDVPAFTVGGVGNANLRPERSAETEAGFDMGLFKDRAALEYTHYVKNTTDALVSVVIPPSAGVAPTRFQNLGRVRNSGDEAQIRATLLTTDLVNFDLTANASFTKNVLEDLGRDAQGNPITPILFGFSSTQRFQKGYPLGAYFARPIISYQDLNKDGIISRVNCPGQPQVAGGPACEVQLGDTAVYLGSPFPKTEFNISPQLQIAKWLTFRALFDHRGGYTLYNNTRSFRCASAFQNCQDVSDPKHTPLADQAKAIAAFMGTQAGYMEKADFTKLREASVTIGIPQRFAARAGVAAASLTVAGRNLHTWTNYSGLDPEVNAFSQNNFATADFLTQPQVRYFTARLAVTF